MKTVSNSMFDISETKTASFNIDHKNKTIEMTFSDSKNNEIKSVYFSGKEEYDNMATFFREAESDILIASVREKQSK